MSLAMATRKIPSDARVASVANLLIELDGYDTALDTARCNASMPYKCGETFDHAFWGRVVDVLQQRGRNGGRS